MSERHVWTFFYGSFINQEVLKQYDVIPQSVEVAKLGGYDIAFNPLATLIPGDQRCVYGIVAALTHTQLRKLYSQDWVSGYDPYAVLVETTEGKLIPALCYIAAKEAEPSRPTSDYLMKIVAPAEAYGFPGWYMERLKQFLAEGD